MKKIFKIVLGSLMIFNLAACSWFGDDAVKPAPLVNFTQTLHAHKEWSNNNSTGTAKQYLKMTPAMSNGKIYTVSYLGKVRAINKLTGRTIWKTSLGTHLTSGVAVDNDMLFLCGSRGQILALSQQNGAIKWRTNFNNEILAVPVAASGKIKIKTEGQLIALDQQNGLKLWSYEQEQPSLVLRGSNTPKIVGDMVITGFANGNIAALDINTGRLIWQSALAESTGSSMIERMIDVDADMAVIGNVVYASSYQGNIAAVSLKGQLLWKRALSSYTGVAADVAKVYVSDSYGTVWALDRQTGTVVWQQKALADREITAPVLYGNNYLAVGDKEGYVHFMRISDGRFVARIKAGSSRIIAAPIADSGDLYVMLTSGTLVKVRI